MFLCQWCNCYWDIFNPETFLTELHVAAVNYDVARTPKNSGGDPCSSRCPRNDTNSLLRFFLLCKKSNFWLTIRAKDKRESVTCRYEFRSGQSSPVPLQTDTYCQNTNGHRRGAKFRVTGQYVQPPPSSGTCSLTAPGAITPCGTAPVR